MQLWRVGTRISRDDIGRAWLAARPESRHNSGRHSCSNRPMSRVKGGILGWLRVTPFYNSRVYLATDQDAVIG